MPHIHTDYGQLDHTVTAYIILVQTGQLPRILLHRHKKLKMLLPVGGHIEITETPWQALAHEIQEESGYSLSELSILQPRVRLTDVVEAVVHPQPFFSNTHSFDGTGGHYHSDLSYAFVAQNVPQRLPAEGESAELMWLTLSELQALGTEQIFENSKQTAIFALDAILGDWQKVPALNYQLTLPAAT